MNTFPTLYYHVFKNVETRELKGLFISDEQSVDNKPIFSGTTILGMNDQDGISNTDVLTATAFRSPGSLEFKLLPMNHEIVSIQTATGYVSAEGIYSDSGVDAATEGFDHIEFAVSAATGEFAGANILVIYFNNVDYSRVVKFI